MGKTIIFFILSFLILITGCRNNNHTLTIDNLLYKFELKSNEDIQQKKKKLTFDEYLFSVKKDIDQLSFKEKSILAFYLLTRFNLDSGGGETFIIVFKLTANTKLRNYLEKKTDKELTNLGLSEERIKQYRLIIAACSDT